ncbi:MAG: iron-sulfur cluster repair protein YtfE [Burkholderiaceae bacterium]|nr:iron-sulfur cluster repair protein YtfE [Burkholderiaceae bacterium]
MDLLNQAIGQIACDIPGATRIFHEHKLDFCCGGNHSLRDAAAKRGVDLTVLTEQLERLREQARPERDWREASPGDVIEYILRRFHEHHREQLPELIRLARRVETVHADKPDCPVGLADHLAFIEQDLASHMMKEEQILFPMLLRGIYAQSIPPIARMRREHDQHGESLARLEQLTSDITPPASACTTWRALYAGLAQLREDLMQHIHLENNVLFTTVEKEAGSISAAGEFACPACSSCC